MSLVEDVVMAKKLGYKSYGEYMQTKGTPPPLRRFVVDGPTCWECGGPLPKGKRKFCSEACVKRREQKRKAVGAYL